MKTAQTLTKLGLFVALSLAAYLGGQYVVAHDLAGSTIILFLIFLAHLFAGILIARAISGRLLVIAISMVFIVAEIKNIEFLFLTGIVPLCMNDRNAAP